LAYYLEPIGPNRFQNSFFTNVPYTTYIRPSLLVGLFPTQCLIQSIFAETHVIDLRLLSVEAGMYVSDEPGFYLEGERTIGIPFLNPNLNLSHFYCPQ
jgi:hypothetical protein